MDLAGKIYTTESIYKHAIILHKEMRLNRCLLCLFIENDVFWGILLNGMWQLGWEGSLGQNGYMYMHD